MGLTSWARRPVLAGGSARSARDSAAVRCSLICSAAASASARNWSASAARCSAAAARASAVAARCSAAARTASTSASAAVGSARVSIRSRSSAPERGDPVGLGAQRPQQLRAGHPGHRHRAGVIGRADRGAGLLRRHPSAFPPRRHAGVAAPGAVFRRPAGAFGRGGALVRTPGTCTPAVPCRSWWLWWPGWSSALPHRDRPRVREAFRIG